MLSLNFYVNALLPMSPCEKRLCEQIHHSVKVRKGNHLKYHWNSCYASAMVACRCTPKTHQDLCVKSWTNCGQIWTLLKSRHFSSMLRAVSLLISVLSVAQGVIGYQKAGVVGDSFYFGFISFLNLNYYPAIDQPKFLMFSDYYLWNHLRL